MSLRLRVRKDGDVVEKTLPDDVDTARDAVLDLVESVGLKLDYGCRSGTCGSCRVQVVEGAELLREPGPIEEDTLSRCAVDSRTRLACRAHFREGASGILTVESISAGDIDNEK